jgi:hypothetical protein
LGGESMIFISDIGKNYVLRKNNLKGFNMRVR